MGPLRSLHSVQLIIVLLVGSQVRTLGRSMGLVLAYATGAVAVASLIFMQWEFRHPRLKLKKPAEPEISLKLN